MARQMTRKKLVEENEMLWSTVESIYNEMAELLGYDQEDEEASDESGED